MNTVDALAPIVLILCITYLIKIVVDAHMHKHMINAGGSEDLVKSIIRGEDSRRRHSSLHWGIVLLSVGAGFALIQWFGWHDITPGVIAVLAIAVGIGNLVFFAISRKTE